MPRTFTAAELAKFTPEMMKTLTDEEIRAYWIQRQQARAAEGKPHYTKLIGLDGKVAVTLR